MSQSEAPVNKDFKNTIQWFPGHMVTALRKLEAWLKLIDVVVEVVDARLPAMSMNPELDRLIGERPRLLMLGRDDLADPDITRSWLAYYAARGRDVVAVTGKEQPSVNRAHVELDRLIAGKTKARAIVVGVPNTGKSSIINGLLGRSAAKTENKAGVTRQLRWFRLSPTLELMDTPGILVPKIPTADAQWMLAVTGALPRERYDPEDVASRLGVWAATAKPSRARIPDLETFAHNRGFLRRGGEVDTHNAAGAYIKDFNEGKFGRVSFERPPESAA